jgi:uncharacterized membrane protein
MSNFISLTVIMALLGSALIAGVFFAFSSFIMKALARLSSSEGMAAMQSINVVVINPVFLGVFMGTAIVSLIVAVLAILSWESTSAAYYLVGAVLYIVGTFMVTGLGNVPLNNKLASTEVTDLTANAIWQHYLKRWTQLNTLRTVCSLAAAMVLLVGLISD